MKKFGPAAGMSAKTTITADYFKHFKAGQLDPGGTKPIDWFTGKKLRKKCSDLIAAFTGLP